MKCDSDTIRSAITLLRALLARYILIRFPEVVNRIVSFFDPSERLVRLQLRYCIMYYMPLTIPRVSGGRLPALEIMYNDIKAITDGILSGDTDLYPHR